MKEEIQVIRAETSVQSKTYDEDALAHLRRIQERWKSGLESLAREIKEKGDHKGVSELKKVEDTLGKTLATLEEKLRKTGEERREPRLLRRGIEFFVTLNNMVKKIRMLGRSEVVDEFGMDPVFIELVTPFFNFLYKTYWRVDAEGLQNVPETGRAILLANHSGLLPYDGAMITTAVRLHHPAGRIVRFMAEDMFSTFPVLAPLFARGGTVRACQENAERLLIQENLVCVFPEGVKGIGKYFTQRYQLQRFGRGGVIALSLRTRSPIIPVAVVGAEEIHPIIAKSDLLARILGIPFFPITATWPWLGPLGLIPLPSKWSIRFGDPTDFHEQYGPGDVENELLINKLNEKVRAAIQGMIVEVLRKRRSTFFG